MKKKIKVSVSEYEWYPVYMISKEMEAFPLDDVIELTQEEYNFILKAFKNFEKAQKIIKQKLKEG